MSQCLINPSLGGIYTVIVWRPLDHISARVELMIAQNGGQQKKVFGDNMSSTGGLPFIAIATAQWLTMRPVKARLDVSDRPQE